MIEQIIKFQNQDLFINFPPVGAWAQLKKTPSNGPRISPNYSSIWENPHILNNFILLEKKPYFIFLKFNTI
jgi:hypothetical protein